MAYMTSVKFLCKFDNASYIYDTITSDFPDVVGDPVKVVTPEGGYLMQQDQYLTWQGRATDILKTMTVGFWLRPSHPGVSTNADGTAIEDLNLSLFELAPYLGDVYDEPPSLIVSEKCGVDGRNSMVVTIYGATLSNVWTGTSESYLPGVWHYFWITYNGTLDQVNLFLDGKQTTWSSTSGSVPQKVVGSFLDLNVNKYGSSGLQSWATNSGNLKDLVVFNQSYSSEVYATRVVTYGIDYMADTDYSLSNEFDYTFLFDDPSPIRVTSLVSDATGILATRTDGKILKGSMLVWDVSKNFSSASEQDALAQRSDRIFNNSSSSGYSVSSAGLTITNAIIRL